MRNRSMVGSLRGFAAAWVMGLGAVAFALPACGSDDAGTEARAVGSIDLALTGLSSSGQTYRLRQGEIALTGTSTAAVSTEDHLNQSLVSLELPAGGYLAALAEGWYLEQLAEDGTWIEVPAVLTSVNPLPFTVVDQGVTDVTLTFRAGDEVVEFGNGRVHLGIAVDDGEQPPPSQTCEDACATPEAAACSNADLCVPICQELPALVNAECAQVAEAYVACAAGVAGALYVCSVEGYPVADPCLPIFEEVMTCLSGPCSGDADGDGACVETDCNDNDATVHPGAPETCGDGVDQNCDGVDLACAPAEWTCNSAYYGASDGCDCGCGVIDPDCADATAASCAYCGEAGSCSPAGIACPGTISPTNNAVCTGCTVDADGDGYCAELDCNDGDASVFPGATEICGDGIDQSCDGVDPSCGPAGWTCPVNYYGTNDGCDCGCGVLDPDCADATVTSCAYCGDTGSCAVGQACPANIDPANNAICTP